MCWDLGRSYGKEECWEWVCEKWSQRADALVEKAERCLLPRGPLQSTFCRSFARTLLQLPILPLQETAWLLELPRNHCLFSSLTVKRQEFWKASVTSVCKSSSSHPLPQSSQQSEVAIGNNVGTCATLLIFVILCLCEAVSSLSCLWNLLEALAQSSQQPMKVPANRKAMEKSVWLLFIRIDIIVNEPLYVCSICSHSRHDVAQPVALFCSVGKWILLVSWSIPIWISWPKFGGKFHAVKWVLS